MPINLSSFKPTVTEKTKLILGVPLVICGCIVCFPLIKTYEYFRDKRVN